MQLKHACLLCISLALLLAAPLTAYAASAPDQNIATFSVAAYNPATGEVGVAVQSRFFAVGAVVPWCQAGVGAVATQAFGNPTYGPRGLELMGQGYSPMEALVTMLNDDDARTQRQLGLVAAHNSSVNLQPEEPVVGSLNVCAAASTRGSAVSFTGSECLDWAGGLCGVSSDGIVYAVQGNILTGVNVVEAMAEAMKNPAAVRLLPLGSEQQRALGTDDFVGRLLGALVAGQQQGGDSRGMQSAALKVCQAGAGYGGYTDVKYDLRVDDAVDPFEELARLLNHARPFTMSIEGYNLLAAGNYAAAVALFDRLVAMDPADASAHYNLACALSRSGMPDEAMVELAIALEADPALSELAQSDPDLEPLRERPDFQALVAAAAAAPPATQ